MEIEDFQGAPPEVMRWDGSIRDLAEAARILRESGYTAAANEVVMTIRWLVTPQITPARRR